MVQSDYYYVEEVKGEPLPLDELIARVEPTLEDGRRITGVTITDDPERSYQVNLNEPKRAAVFVDQYTGEVLGEPGRLSSSRICSAYTAGLWMSAPRMKRLCFGAR